jgi:protein-L-isoaspartate O-methyltransferase
MLQTDRKYYAPQYPYTDAPQPIGHQQTISAPHMHAEACERVLAALPEAGAKILDVGCGSGYLTAGKACQHYAHALFDVLSAWLAHLWHSCCRTLAFHTFVAKALTTSSSYISLLHILTVFARLAGSDSKVFGIDYIEPLVHLSERNINADDKDLIASGRIKLYTKDGWQGLPDEAPFDAIHVGAAADSVPQELVSTAAAAAKVTCLLHHGSIMIIHAFVTSVLTCVRT